MLSASCPHCQATIKILDRHVGRVVRCPKCRGKFRVSDTASFDNDSSLPHTPTFYEAEESGVSPRALAVAISALLFIVAIGVLIAVASRSGPKAQQQAAGTQSRNVSRG